jgi:hypothetical protein
MTTKTTTVVKEIDSSSSSMSSDHSAETDTQTYADEPEQGKEEVVDDDFIKSSFEEIKDEDITKEDFQKVAKAIKDKVISLTDPIDESAETLEMRGAILGRIITKFPIFQKKWPEEEPKVEKPKNEKPKAEGKGGRPVLKKRPGK